MEDRSYAFRIKRGIYLFSDEVYRLLERRREMTLPQVADLYEKGLSLGVMSKAYGLPGLRIGWIGCRDRELLMRMERMKHYLSICNSGPSEALAGIALKNRQSILERNNALVRTNLDLLDDFFAEYPAPAGVPMSGRGDNIRSPAAFEPGSAYTHRVRRTARGRTA